MNRQIRGLIFILLVAPSANAAVLYRSYKSSQCHVQFSVPKGWQVGEQSCAFAIDPPRWQQTRARAYPELAEHVISIRVLVLDLEAGAHEAGFRRMQELLDWGFREEKEIAPESWMMSGQVTTKATEEVEGGTTRIIGYNAYRRSTRVGGTYAGQGEMQSAVVNDGACHSAVFDGGFDYVFTDAQIFEDVVRSFTFTESTVPCKPEPAN